MKQTNKPEDKKGLLARAGEVIGSAFTSIEDKISNQQKEKEKEVPEFLNTNLAELIKQALGSNPHPQEAFSYIKEFYEKCPSDKTESLRISLTDKLIGKAITNKRIHSPEDGCQTGRVAEFFGKYKDALKCYLDVQYTKEAIEIIKNKIESKDIEWAINSLQTSIDSPTTLINLCIEKELYQKAKNIAVNNELLEKSAEIANLMGDKKSAKEYEEKIIKKKRNALETYFKENKGRFMYELYPHEVREAINLAKELDEQEIALNFLILDGDMLDEVEQIAKILGKPEEYLHREYERIARNLFEHGYAYDALMYARRLPTRDFEIDCMLKFSPKEGLKLAEKYGIETAKTLERRALIEDQKKQPWVYVGLSKEQYEAYQELNKLLKR
jgi:hypothetical protein